MQTTTPKTKRAAENKQQKNDPMQTETNQTDLNPEKLQRNPTQITMNQTNQPQIRPASQESPKPMNGVNAKISALTFGTLLSSQESDAHRASDFRLKLRGNPPNITVSSAASQIGLFRPSLPACLSDRNPLGA
jgi:hypothetical protein